MKLASAIVAFGIFITASTVEAGVDGGIEVTVSVRPDGSGQAGGSLGTVRNSADQTQFIQCGVNVTGSSIYGFCQASDANGTVVLCSTTKRNLVDAMEGVSGDSHVFFEFDSSGKCTRLFVNHGSYLEPKR